MSDEEFPRFVPGAVSETTARFVISRWHPTEQPLKIVAPAGGAIAGVSQQVIEIAPSSPGDADDRWVVDVRGLAPDTEYEVSLDGSSSVSRIRTPPVALGEGDELVIALNSCYFPSDEFRHYPTRALDFLRRRPVPHFKVLSGDQIYADVPWAPLGTPDEVYASRYATSWKRSRLGDLLRHGGNVFTCDDHEYWNGYPDWMPHLGRSFGGNWEEWAAAGMRALWRHASVANFAPGIVGGTPDLGGDTRIEPRLGYRGWCRWKVAGIDVFVTDTRSDRTTADGGRCPERVTEAGACSRDGRPHAMSAAQADALLAWVRRVDRLGVLVLGQPLVMAKDDRSSFDPDLTQFPEHGDLVRALRARLGEGAASFIVLTGDIHWGRLVTWQYGGRRLVEFVSSAMGRVAEANLLSSSFNVAKRARTDLDDAEIALGPDLVPTRLFATAENNAGLLRIRRPSAERYQAEFELWSLETQHLAVNRWNPTEGCFAPLDL